MPVTSVKTTRRGPRELLEVDYRGAALPTLPPVCPCCLDRGEPGSEIKVACGPSVLRFPACRICARHVPFFDVLSSIIGYLSLGLGVLTGLVILVALFGVAAGLTFPFRSLITGLSTLLGLGALTVIYVLVIGGLTWPLRLFLAKRACEDTPVTAACLKNDPAPYAFRFTFEKVRYGRLFAEANGHPAPAPATAPRR